jgi:phage baseplate assembly protein W
MLDDIQGAAFPFRIDPATGGVSMAKGTEKLRQNVRLILGTRVGERPMLRDFGTRLPSLAHEPNDDVLADILQKQTQQALLQWEPRIIVTNMHLQQSEGEAQLNITYFYIYEQLSDQLNVPVA